MLNHGVGVEVGFFRVDRDRTVVVIEKSNNAFTSASRFGYAGKSEKKSYWREMS